MKLTVLLFSLCFIPSSLVAAVDESKSQAVLVTQPPQEKKTSAQNREGKTVQFAASIFGVGSGAQSAGLQASYLLNNLVSVT